MRWFSTRPQISAFRPFAWIENSLAARALTLRNKLKARAAASNAGPRFADVAGRTSSRDSRLFIPKFLQNLDNRARVGLKNYRRSLLRHENWVDAAGK